MDQTPKIGIKLLKGDKYKPVKAYKDDACYDVFAASIEYEDDYKIHFGLGFSLEVPSGYRVDIRSRSSVHKVGLILSNGVGTGDAGYKGEYQVVFYKVLLKAPFYKVGDRIAQLKIEKITNFEFENIEYHSDSDRGEGGYGSSGV